MEGFRIHGGEKIRGEARVDASKNAVLPILAACILQTGETTLTGCPDISDIRSMLEILTTLGCRVRSESGAVTVDTRGLTSWEMPDDLSKRIRSSIFLLGPILGRMRKATVTYPGGCEIGLRPIDLHLAGLRQLGVVIQEEGGVIHCDGANMRAGDVHFDYPSVGATENVMMAAALIPGRTTISNAAREPEIADLQRFINRMGGRASGAGEHTVTVEGVRELRGVQYAPIADRIVAGTWLAAAAITGGEIALTGARPGDMVAVLAKLREMGCEVSAQKRLLRLRAPARLSAFSQVQTQPYPGFPTDMQAQTLALATVAEGASVVVENVFENRFAHVGDLNSMGANIRLNGRTALVQGVKKLHGMRVTARDLRGGAALVLAGLAARGETLVENVAVIDRGYEKPERTLQALGASIERITL